MCTGIFGKRDIGRIEREYLDVLNFELKVSEDDVLNHHLGLTAAAHLPPSPRHSPRSAVMRLSRSTQEPEPEPVHVHTQRRHASHQYRRRRDSLSQHVPELQPDSPASSSSDNSSLVGPQTPDFVDPSPSHVSKSSTSKSTTSARKVLGLDASQFQSRTIDSIIRRFPQIPRMHTWLRSLTFLYITPPCYPITIYINSSVINNEAPCGLLQKKHLCVFYSAVAFLLSVSNHMTIFLVFIPPALFRISTYMF